MSKYYISTAIPYINAHPHIGFVLEIVQADVLARYHRSIGDDVFFLTGTDENSLKNVRVAEQKGVSVKDLVEEYSKLSNRFSKACLSRKNPLVDSLPFSETIRTKPFSFLAGFVLISDSFTNFSLRNNLFIHIFLNFYSIIIGV